MIAASDPVAALHFLPAYRTESEFNSMWALQFSG